MCKIDVEELAWPIEKQSGRIECDCIQRLGPIVFKGTCKWKTVDEPECEVPPVQPVEPIEVMEPPGQMNFGYPENYGKTTIDSLTIPKEDPTTTLITTTTTSTTTEFNLVPIPCLPYINSKPKKVPRICREFMPTTTTTTTSTVSTTSTTSTTTTTTTTTAVKKRKTKGKMSRGCQEMFHSRKQSAYHIIC